ncbi:MAG: hypothetical protein WCS52_07345 [bacterium]
MADEHKDVFSQALINLEQELAAFGSVQKALKGAHDELIKAEEEWAQLTKEQQQTAVELVSSTKDAIAATHAVTSQTEALAGALIPLAKAIEQVNFPMRLDKIDLGISTQASTMATFQGAIDRGFSSVCAEVDKNGKTMADGFTAVSESQVAARKRDVMMTALLVINTLILTGLGVFYFIHRVKAAGM